MRPAVGELVRSTAGQWIARLYGWLPVAAPGRILGRVYRLLVWSALDMVL
jgi:hypothetical protein